MKLAIFALVWCSVFFVYDVVMYFVSPQYAVLYVVLAFIMLACVVFNIFTIRNYSRMNKRKQLYSRMQR